MGKFKNFLLDQFNTGVHIQGTNMYVEVYKNPVKSEVESIMKNDKLKSVRIGIIGNDIYCWPSFVLHDKMEKAMNCKFGVKLTWDKDFSEILTGSDCSKSNITKSIKEKLRKIFPDVEAISLNSNRMHVVPLNEDFYKAMDVDSMHFKGYIEIYKNPSKTEVDGLYRESYADGVRMGIDSKNNIYVWIEDVLHDVMQRLINIKFTLRFEYTRGRPSLFLSSGESKDNFDAHINNVLLKRLKILYPNISDIKESTGKFRVVHKF